MEANQEWTTGTLEFSLYGDPVEVELTVPSKPVALRRMLPILQQMTESFLEIGVNKVESEGKQVSCAKGCGACCRQLIPVSEAETVLIKELVESLPEPRRSIMEKRFADACRYFYENKWFEKVDKIKNLSPVEQRALIDEYFEEGIPCPFLEEEACSIHQNRPLVCREYLVTSPPENCSHPTEENIERVKLLFLTSDTILNIENKQPTKPIDFVPLIFSLAFARQDTRQPIAKTGMEWMREFFQGLEEQQKK